MTPESSRRGGAPESSRRGGAPESSRRGRAFDLALLALGLIVLWAAPHNMFGSDARVRYEALDRLLTHGTLESIRYSAVGPIFATPLWLIGHFLGAPAEATAFFNVVLFTLAVGVLWRELGQVVSDTTRRTALLLLVYASMFPNHVQLFYGEVFTALCATLAVFWFARGSRAGRIGGFVLIVLGTVNTPGTLVAVALVAARTALLERKLHARGWGWIWPLAIPPVAFALTSLENLLTRGAPGASGYANDAGFHTFMPYSGRPGFSYPLLFGLLAILFSFGKGLVFFTPGLFCPLEKSTSARLRWIQGTLLSFVLGLVLVYSRWWAWYGGWFWGPRFFLLASIPASLALASQLTSRLDGRRPWILLLLAAATLWSFWVGAEGLALEQTGLEKCIENDWAFESLCHFVPEFSPLFRPFVDFRSSVPGVARGHGHPALAAAVIAVWMLAGIWVTRGPLRLLVQRVAELPRELRKALRRD